MNFAFLTPGTGSYYCGACMRDNALAKSLLAAGHRVSLLPMYLPLQLDEERLEQPDTPIFFGGINVYLQQKLTWFRRSPEWLDNLLNSTGLLRAAAKRSHMTSPHEHGAMTLAMLDLEHSAFGKETAKLLDWLEHDRPDVVVLSNALLAGFIRTLKQRLGCRVITTFQGEDSFLDGLPEPHKSRCWAEMKTRLADSDLLIAPSRYYAGFMRERLGDPGLDIAVMPNGVTIPDPPISHLQSPISPPTVGYLARMIREKGVELLVDAFIHLRLQLRHPDARLRIAGSETEGDKALVRELKHRLEHAGLTGHVTWSPNLDHDRKAGFLAGLTLFSVPATYHEAFGLYAIEALAAGVPLVMPRASSFPEIIETSGAGVLCEPNDPAALASAWHEVLNDEVRLATYRENALRAARETYSVEAMRERFLELVETIPGR
jgi:glycosyltransferase involved in cell wall biosynthesis